MVALVLKRRGLASCLAVIAIFVAATGGTPRPRTRRAAAPRIRAPGTYVTLLTSLGDIVLRMLPQDAPETVANFVGLVEGSKPFRDPRSAHLVKRPFYDGLTFHRVIKGFMIQAGSPKGDGTDGPGFTIPDELPPRRPYVPGAVLMSHGSRPNSAGSQFFILVGDVRDHLPQQYVVFAEVVQGMAVADRIAAAPVKPNLFRPNERSTPVHPVVIEKATVTRVR